MGVRTIALSEGCTIGPPAESEYAVDPVGVDTMIPSDLKWSSNLKSSRKGKVAIDEDANIALLL